MKIVDNRQGRESFEHLGIGDIFMYCDHLHVKITCNDALDLQSRIVGDFTRYAHSILVEPVDVTITINAISSETD